MSIINKMHQDFQQIQEAQPILATMPGENSKKKGFLLLFILLLTASSLALSYLIFTQEKAREETVIAAAETAVPVAGPALKNAPKSAAALAEKAIVKAAPVKSSARSQATDKVKKSQVLAVKTVTEKEAEQKTGRKAVADKDAQVASTTPADRKRASAIPEKAAVPLTIQSEKNNYLEIKTVKLSKAQLAQIHLKEADRAQAQGDFELAARKRLQALELLPTLNEVRKSLALYYYGQGEVTKASALLKSGAVVSPDYSDFNLMLSRIALKAGDYQKAYLYLEQHPPQVKGHLDYYVSHAILAQKFQKYEQAERLYKSLLSQRPNNGRWRMSLAIAQDRQAKAELAFSSYKIALLQPDLSSKAKAYIKQRLTYLERQ